MHAKFLQVDGGKMSKSLGNVYTLDDVRRAGFTPRALRFALIRGHYRQPLNFTWDIMRDASARAREPRRPRRAPAPAPPRQSDRGAERRARARRGRARRFEEAMDDDLNVGRALAPLFGLRAEVLEGRLGGASAREAAGVPRAGRTACSACSSSPPRDLDGEVAPRIEEREAARRERATGPTPTASATSSPRAGSCSRTPRAGSSGVRSSAARYCVRIGFEAVSGSFRPKPVTSNSAEPVTARARAMNWPKATSGVPQPVVSSALSKR